MSVIAPQASRKGVQTNRAGLDLMDEPRLFHLPRTFGRNQYGAPPHARRGPAFDPR